MHKDLKCNAQTPKMQWRAPNMKNFTRQQESSAA